MRKELGSPRMSDYSHPGFGLDPLPPPDDRMQAAPPSHARTKNEPSFLQELGSALVSCGGGNSTRNAQRNPSEVLNVATSWVRFKDSFQKAVKGDIDAAKEAWKTRAGEFSLDDFGIHSVGSHDSIFTYDNCSVINQRQAQQEEEAMQLRRLTSWGTVGTYETAETLGTREFNKSKTAVPHRTTVVEDDDGIPIDVQLLQKTKLPLSSKPPQNQQPRRKRVVRFDYPPISSLRECPRTQPEQIEDLFFTEHELEQIEDDRYSTISADDVEIVAISTSTTNESCDKDENDFRSYTPNKKKESFRKKRHTFSFDEMRSSVGGASASTTTDKKANARRRRGSADASSSSCSQKGSSPSSGSSRRMIKSVQIYLRERSVG